MLGTGTLGDDMLDAEFFQVQNGEERSFEVCADAADDRVDLRHRKRCELLLAGCVGDNCMGDVRGDVLHFVRRVVYSEHFTAEARQMVGEKDSRVAKSDDDELLFCHCLTHHDVFFCVPGSRILFLHHGGDEEEGAHTAYEHKDTNKDSAGSGKFRGETKRKPAG